MLIVGKSIQIPVDIINIASPSFKTHSGWIRSFENGFYRIELSSRDVNIGKGIRVVLNCHSQPKQRISATVTRAWPDGFEALERRAVQPDRRYWPRLMGSIPLKYQVSNSGSLALEWSLKKTSMDESSWHRPDPFMDFSVSGLCFRDKPLCMPDDLLLCELAVGIRTLRWRTLARVIRLSPCLEDQELRWIALKFERLPDEAAEALTEYTLRLQNHRY